MLIQIYTFIIAAMCVIICILLDSKKSYSPQHQPTPQPQTTIKQVVRPTDVIKDYDYRNMYDPLKQPARRVARHEIHPLHLKRLIDIPTIGYPDNFTQLGILVKKGDPTQNEENKILRLYGRQIYPGSYAYEYYTSVNSGLDQIKIPIKTRGKKELFDGDNIYVKELNEKYDINLFKHDEPKYYPDIIY